MTRERDSVDYDHAQESAELATTIRRVFKPSQVQPTAKTCAINDLVGQIEKLLSKTAGSRQPIEWRLATAALRALHAQLKCLEIAKGAKGDLQQERIRAEVLADELQSLLEQNDHTNGNIFQSKSLSQRLNFLNDASVSYATVRKLLTQLPLPTIYRRLDNPSRALRDSAPRQASEHQNPVLRIIVFLDDSPLATPQFLRPQVLYSLRLRIKGIKWPKEARDLHITLTTTCPASEYSASTFILNNPETVLDGEYEMEASGHIRLNSPQSSMLEDIVFSIGAAFKVGPEDYLDASLIGHNELRLRVNDALRLPLSTGSSPLDQHLVNLLVDLTKESPAVRDELPNLFEMLQALTRLIAAYAQAAVFKSRDDILESEFQESVVRDLRLQLGNDVQEHPSQAGGITDIRYRGVIVELKVERQNGDRSYIANKYSEQVVQYSGVEARQVSVLLVLDTTDKEKPTGDIRNDILLVDVEGHGNRKPQTKYPSKVFVFVVNGNTRRPSEYSK